MRKSTSKACVENIIKMKSEGYSVAQIAAENGISSAVVYRRLKEAKLKCMNDKRESCFLSDRSETVRNIFESNESNSGLILFGVM